MPPGTREITEGLRRRKTMSQEWVSSTDHRWQMTCDTPGCHTVCAPTAERQNLQIFADAGWFIAVTYGDACPGCISSGKIAPEMLGLSISRQGN
jgi:hypothetical protein